MTAIRILLFTIVCLCAAPAAALTFLVHGDMPYGAPWPEGGRYKTDFDFMKSVMAPAVRDDPSIAFVIHYGDSGRPVYACSDDWLRGQQTFWRNELVKPVFFTPGDNDWTDCDREVIPAPGSELERLAAVRRVLFARRSTLAENWHYRRQSLYPENALWRRGGVQFATLHVVGTNDGRGQIRRDIAAIARARVTARQAAVRDWLSAAVEEAKASDAVALVVAMQADPFKGWGTVACSDAMPEKCDAFLELRAALVAAAKALGRPMLVVHGDTAPYCLDRPFGDDAPAALWRLNGPGDFRVIDAAKVTIQADSVELPFRVEGLRTGPLPNAPCP